MRYRYEPPEEPEPWPARRWCVPARRRQPHRRPPPLALPAPQPSPAPAPAPDPLPLPGPVPALLPPRRPAPWPRPPLHRRRLRRVPRPCRPRPAGQSVGDAVTAVSTDTIGTRTVQALGTFASLLVTDPDRLEQAWALFAGELLAIDLACSRFRSDSE